MAKSDIENTGARIVIEPEERWIALQLKELWRYRELLFFIAWRDITVRYKQTVLGAMWAILQPFLNMIVFSLIFGRLAKLPSDNLPYPIFSYAALLPWQYFSTAMSSASNSLVGSSGLISKVYFPRLIVPMASVLPPIADFAIAFVLLLLMMVYYGIAPTINVIFLPFFLLLALVMALGVGLWLSALNVQYRDIRYTIPFIIQFWLFASPVAYSSSLIPDRWRALYGLNPMAGVIEGFRWALLGADTSPGPLIGISVLVSLAVLVTGAFYFRRMERVFADII